MSSFDTLDTLMTRSFLEKEGEEGWGGLMTSRAMGKKISVLRPLQGKVKAAGMANEVVEVTTEAIPAELEWGRVFVSMRAAPISPADTYTMLMGGVYNDVTQSMPYIGGHDGIGVVMKVN